MLKKNASIIYLGLVSSPDYNAQKKCQHYLSGPSLVPRPYPAFYVECGMWMRLYLYKNYQLYIETPGMPPTLRPLINDTARNNQTVITCTGLSESIESIETTLFIYGMLKHINVLAVSV